MLEPKQQKLLDNLNKLQTRTDIESVLKGKKTTLPSSTIAREAKAVERNEVKAQEALNKQTEKTFKEKLKGIEKSIKSFYQGQAQGYKQGAIDQQKETREIRKQFRNALRESGIKQKEISAFDSISKNLVTLNDLIKSKDAIASKMREVLEKRKTRSGA